MLSGRLHFRQRVCYRVAVPYDACLNTVALCGTATPSLPPQRVQGGSMSHPTLHRTAAACAFVVIGAIYLVVVARLVVALGDVLPPGLRDAAGVALGIGALALAGACMGGRR